MSELAPSGCPPLAALLRVTDGEASTTERRSVSTHLWRCSSCRDRLASLESTAEDCARLVDDAMPMAASTDRFLAGLHEHLRSHPVRFGSSRRWLTAAVAVPAVVLILLLSRSYTVTLQAEALLARALEVEAAAPPAIRPTSLRWLPHVAPASSATVRVSASDAGSGAYSERPSAVDPAVLAQLRLYGVDLLQPLSVKPFRAWRASLRNRSDVVRELDGLLVLRTTSTQGPIRMGELAVRPNTYALVRETFVLDGLGRVDLEPAADDDAPRASTVPEAALPLTVETTALERDARDHAELRVRLALRATDLDLTDAVRIVASGASDGNVRIEGATSSAMRNRMAHALMGVRHVDMAVRVEETALVEGVTPAATIGLTRWLDRTYGPEDSLARERFVPELRHNATLVSKHLQALEALAHRYPASVVRDMPAPRRALLQTLVEQHHAALAETLNAYGAQIAVLSGATPRVSVARTTVPGDWRGRVRQATKPAADLERRLTFERLFENEDYTRGASSPGAVAIRSTFERLWDSLNRS